MIPPQGGVGETVDRRLVDPDHQVPRLLTAGGARRGQRAVGGLQHRQVQCVRGGPETEHLRKQVPLQKRPAEILRQVAVGPGDQLLGLLVHALAELLLGVAGGDALGLGLLLRGPLPGHPLHGRAPLFDTMALIVVDISA